MSHSIDVIRIDDPVSQDDVLFAHDALMKARNTLSFIPYVECEDILTARNVLVACRRGKMMIRIAKLMHLSHATGSHIQSDAFVAAGMQLGFAFRWDRALAESHYNNVAIGVNRYHYGRVLAEIYPCREGL
jgi:hypothetical protein